MIILLVGCSGIPEPTEIHPAAIATNIAVSPSATNALTSTDASISPFLPEIVNFAEANDESIVCALYRPENENSNPNPAVLLLQMHRGNNREWKDVAMKLAESGYVVLAIDMRGHGETGLRQVWVAAKALGDVNLVMYDDVGHGTQMFSREPDLIMSIIEWLDTHL